MSTGNGWNFYLSKIILLLYFLYIVDFDLSIASTKTKYIKLNTKTQNIFCCLNESLMTPGPPPGSPGLPQGPPGAFLAAAQFLSLTTTKNFYVD